MHLESTFQPIYKSSITLEAQKEYAERYSVDKSRAVELHTQYHQDALPEVLKTRNVLHLCPNSNIETRLLHASSQEEFEGCAIAKIIDVCKTIIAGNHKHIPKAKTGKTPVFLPQGKLSAIVIKQCKTDKVALARHKQISCLSQKIDALGLDHLTVQNSAVLNAGNDNYFLIESKLPISTGNYVSTQYSTRNLLSNHSDKFDTAVDQLCTLFSHDTFIQNLLIDSNSARGSLVLGTFPISRYDNLAPYLDGDRGKIALVDIEHIEWENNPNALSTILHLFPGNKNIIATHLPKIADHNLTQLFDYIEILGLKSLSCFHEPVANLIQRGITYINYKNHFLPETFKPECVDRLKETCVNYLKSINTGNYLQRFYPDFYIENEATKTYALNYLSPSFPIDTSQITTKLCKKILSTMLTTLKRRIKEKTTSLDPNQCSKKRFLLFSRVIHIPSASTITVEMDLPENIQNQLRNAIILSFFLEELKTNGHIFHYDLCKKIEDHTYPTGYLKISY